MPAKQKVLNVTMLDMCVASQEELAKYFSKQGLCFGLLRQQKFTAEREMRINRERNREIAPEAEARRKNNHSSDKGIVAEPRFVSGGFFHRKGLDARDVSRAELMCFAMTD